MSREALWWMDDNPAEFRRSWARALPNPYSDLPFRMQASNDDIGWFSAYRPPVPSQWAALLRVGPPEPWPAADVFEVVTGRSPDLRDPWEDRT